ncbi:MAG: monovalent cation/H(+) antiporter subunit G [Planctomycetota bacterium]|nr:monovalent cation/H(+) antiporter subunit G [Planctomycetota bacterium]
MSFVEWVAVVALVGGALFTLLAAVGVVRMPNVYARLSTTSKAAPFGIGLVLLGAALYARDGGFAVIAAAAAVFLALTSPIAAHALARAVRRASDDDRV